jgi:hypothetical protein
MTELDTTTKQAIERLHIAMNQIYNDTKLNRSTAGAKRYSQIVGWLDLARDAAREGLE